jgi:hypothetical protein
MRFRHSWMIGNFSFYIVSSLDLWFSCSSWWSRRSLCSIESLRTLSLNHDFHHLRVKSSDSILKNSSEASFTKILMQHQKTSFAKAVLAKFMNKDWIEMHKCNMDPKLLQWRTRFSFNSIFDCLTTEAEISMLQDSHLSCTDSPVNQWYHLSARMSKTFTKFAGSFLGIRIKPRIYEFSKILDELKHLLIN